MREGEISIWFFIGISLLVNGILITAAGVWQMMHPPANPVVLFELHAPVWWGAMLAVLGLAACIHFRPGKTA